MKNTETSLEFLEAQFQNVRISLKKVHLSRLTACILAQVWITLYDVARLHLTAPMDFWQNLPQLSVQPKIALLEDNLKNEVDVKDNDKPKNKIDRFCVMS